MQLSDEDVFQILKIVEQFSLDFFQLEMGDLKIIVNKGGNESDFAQIPKSKVSPGSDF